MEWTQFTWTSPKPSTRLSETEVLFHKLRSSKALGKVGRVSRSIVDQGADCQALQDDLTTVYYWAEDVNMTFNSEKFECIRYWPINTKPDYINKSSDGSVIEEKDHLRDLGVEMASDLTFSIHISNTVTAANRLVGWALRSFWRRSRLVMLTL